MVETVGMVFDRIEAQQALALTVGPEANSLDFLQLVYRNGSLPLTTRMRAAIAALPFEAPKLAVTAVVSEDDFATLLDQRIERMKLLEARAINGDTAIETKPNSTIEVRPALPDWPPLSGPGGMLV
jgi:hypothetical protein